ncbi:MAG: PHP domain-containing protein [Candidatus Aenigmarchaeota archaeon]|nr:PHP domain-containing protein [Candidatus Aenigmarchaeota archaeon]
MRLDCHCHTIYSKHFLWGYDSISKPRDLIKSAIRKGLDGIAVTDHDCVKGSLATKKIAKSFKGFIVVTGSEIKTAKGDVQGLGITEDVPNRLSVEETVERIHDLGGIAVAVHPFGNYIFRQGVGKEALKADAIEIFNGANLFNHSNEKARLLARRYKRPVTGGSDAHSTREVGNCGIEFEGDPLEAIMKKKVKVFGKKNSMADMARLTYKKFTRAGKWRILRKRGKRF